MNSENEIKQEIKEKYKNTYHNIIFNLVNKIKNLEVKKCKWSYDDFDKTYYVTSCNNNFYFIEGNFKDNNFKYCPFCGGKIINGC